MESIGPGENTADAARLPRALRHPLVTSEDSPELNASQTKALGNVHPEIRDVAYSYRSLTAATVAASIAAAPNVLNPYRFAIYPLV